MKLLTMATVIIFEVLLLVKCLFSIIHADNRMYTCEDSGGVQLEWEKVCDGKVDCTAGDDETKTACEDSIGMKDDPSENRVSTIFENFG